MVQTYILSRLLKREGRALLRIRPAIGPKELPFLLVLHTTVCPQTDTEDDHPILRREVEAAVQSLEKGKSAGDDYISAELVQAGGKDAITALKTICNKIWQTGEWPTPWTQFLVITLPKKGNLQQCQIYRTKNPHQSPKQSHAEDHTEQIEATSGEDHR